MSATYDITLPADHDYLASLPVGGPNGIRDELVLRADGVAVLFMRTAKIASYAGESVTTPYRSTTGALTTGATVIYGVPLTTKYSADNGATWSTTAPAAGQSAIPLYKGTNNVWCPDPLSPEISLDYVQDTNKVINELRVDITGLEAAWDSVSRAPRLFINSGVWQANGDYIRLWSSSEFVSAFGRAFDTNKDFVSIMNCDGVTAGIRIYPPEVWNGDIWVYFGRAYTGPIRLNYLVALAP